MAKKRKALGRGLDAILPSNVPAAVPDTKEASPVGVALIPLQQIETNPFQPRNDFDEQALSELADSIKEHGIIQPLTLRKLAKGQYQLIAGERRLRAAKLAELNEVPAYVRVANDEQMLEMALIENIQREDLNPIEIALSYQRMISELGLKQGELGAKVGKKRSSVTNYLRLLKLPPEIEKALKVGKISFGHGRSLIGVEDKEKQLQVFETIIDKGLSVRQTEDLVRKLGQTKAPKKAAHKQDPNRIHLYSLERKLEERFGNRVSLNQKKDGKGEIRISFSSNDDLNRILEMLEEN